MENDRGLHAPRRIDAREVWGHEAVDFTPLVYDHIEELNQAIGIEFEPTGREEPVGRFAVDIFGRDVQTGRPAIIENQLEKTDHSHLGQLITYAAGLDAGTIIWVAPKFLDEYRRALDWLNEIRGEETNFFGIEVEVLEINGQRAANFQLAAQPNAWHKSGPIGPNRPEVSERNRRYQAYFAGLLEDLKARKPDATSAQRTQPASWFWFAAGRAGASFSWAFTKDKRFRVDLSVNAGSEAASAAILDAFETETDALAEEIGEPLEWDRMVGRQEQRVRVYFPQEGVTIDAGDAQLHAIHDWAVPTMAKFIDAFRPRLKALP